MGGSIALSGLSSDYVLQFAFNNGTWSTVGDGVGGPVTAIIAKQWQREQHLRCRAVHVYPALPVVGNLMSV